VRYVWSDNVTPPFVGYGPAGVLAQGDSGVYHLLGHLDPAGWTDASRPTKGQRFDVGEEIGFPAPTGSPGVGAAKPHVHWEVRVEPIDSPATRGGNTLDPVQWARGFSSSTRVGAPAADGLWFLVLFGLWYLTRKS
jgi:murein DD-endopeptidase MepM/ murein hydrolase activator NlpD